MNVGRGVFFKKQTVDSALKLDIAWISRKYDFSSHAVGDVSWTSGWGKTDRIALIIEPGGSMRLKYGATDSRGNTTSHDYWVNLETTPCHFGGHRWWFLCPECDRRCRILYLPGGEEIFACRVCHNLTYRSQQEGTSRSGWLMKALLLGPALQRKFLRTRSHNRRQAVWKQLERMERHVLESARDLESKTKRGRK